MLYYYDSIYNIRLISVISGRSFVGAAVIFYLGVKLKSATQKNALTWGKFYQL